MRILLLACGSSWILSDLGLPTPGIEHNLVIHQAPLQSTPHDILLYSLYNILMLATKYIFVTEAVWAELSELKRPGETFDQLLSEMIEREKKARLIEHLLKIAEDGEFVEMQM
jgi:predicted CopG family antitoxin